MIVSVRGVHFAYNGRQVLENVSFDLEPNTVLAVLGVNGAGKSTLLKCINRVLRPHGGVVMLDGDDVRRLSGREIARRVGYVPQRFGGEELVVFDAVLLGRKPHIGWIASENDFRVVDRVLAVMGLEHLALRPVSELSGGEAQKVALARALAQEPQLLLLDEPVSNLDVKNQMEVMTLVTQAVRSGGLSAMIAIHDLNLALRFADRFLMVKGGAIEALVDRDGITEAIIEDVYEIRAVIREVEGHSVVIPVSHCCVSREPLPAGARGICG